MMMPHHRALPKGLWIDSASQAKISVGQRLLTLIITYNESVRSLTTCKYIRINFVTVLSYILI